MGIGSGLVVFLLIWWTALFCVLPWGNAAPDTPETGMAASAPKNPRLKQKFIATTILSAVLWLVVFAVIEWAPISFSEAAREMSAQDQMR